MQPTTEILARLNQNSKAHPEEVFTRLYRYLLRPDLYFIAYKNLYANGGAATNGVNDDTADGFSEAKIARIIKALSDGTYTPHPVRRTYIRKANGRLRPLGVPTFTDKLVQEVLRMVLEAIYEPVFLDCSYGFRPKRGCHTALKDLKHQFHGTRWFVEGDIKGCFDNIDHAALIGILNNKIRDARVNQLICKFLKAGYLEDWQYHNTYCGTPQGGIISPLLSNIYLHELDKFVMKLKAEFDKPKTQHFTYEYGVAQRRLKALKAQIGQATGTVREELIHQYKLAKQELLKTPCKSQTDKVIKYIRYADDFIIGVNGTRDDCVAIKRRLTAFIRDMLNMELSAEKTLITHSSECARFLGYDVRVRRENKVIKRGGPTHSTKRTLNNMTELLVPLNDKIHKFLFVKSIVEQRADGTLFPIHRKNMVNLSDLEIVTTYNAELRGICNYYSMASNFYKLNYFGYLMEYSCLKTLASKHKCHISDICDRFRAGQGRWGVPYETKTGVKRCLFAKYSDSKNVKEPSNVMPNLFAQYSCMANSFESRLKAKTCELCGTTEAKHYEIHHVRQLKDLKGKTAVERAMIGRRRKTIVLCKQCHIETHHPPSSDKASNNGSRVHREV